MGDATPATTSPAVKRSQSPRTPKNILANIAPGKDIYSRGQKHLARQKNVLEKKKRALEEEELQKGPKINARSSSLMRNRRQPGWLRTGSPTANDPYYNGSTRHHAVNLTSNMKISDVVQACISADQAVERILASPSPERSGSFRKARSSSVGVARPEFYIQRNAEADADLFVSPDAMLQSKVEEQEITITQQASRIAELEDMLAYLSHAVGVDLGRYRKERGERKTGFWNSTAVWECVASFIDFPWGMRLRLVGGGAVKAAEKRYQKWFTEGVKRVFRVNDYQFNQLIVPGEGLVKVLLDHVEAQVVGSGEEVLDGMVLEPPLRLSVRGNGDITFVTSFITKDSDTAVQPRTPPHLHAELPQGTLEITSQTDSSISFTFSHPRWYPLPGDSVVLIEPTAEIPPLTPSIADLPAVRAQKLNEDFENPWTSELQLGEGAAGGNEYEARYIDSLGRPLARSKAFSLSSTDEKK